MSSPTSTDVAAAIGDLVLHDADGTSFALADLAADPLVVVAPRYYGCLPCQAFIKELDDRVDELPAGAGVLSVAGSATHQARWLRDERDVRMPLLLDEDARLRQLLELGNLTPLQLANAKGLRSYAAAVRDGWKPQRITSDTVRSPGLAVLGPDLDVLWTHEGSRLGDYPPVDEVVRRAHELRTAG